MNYFITGIGTGVGKTIVSAIITEALEADYWKPVQAGILDSTDTQKVKGLVSNALSVFHPEAFKLQAAISPHAAAALEKTEIIPEQIRIPETSNNLIIEGAGGIMAPINNKQTMLDLMAHFDATVILVSSNYLGSINHTLLSWERLKTAGIRLKGIIFNGEPNPETERFILTYTQLPCLLNLTPENPVSKEVIRRYAALVKKKLI